MMRYIYFSILVIVAIALPACSRANEMSFANSNAAGEGTATYETTIASRQPADSEAPESGRADKNEALSASKDVADTGTPIERKIIRDADLSLESKEPAEVLRKVTSIAEKMGGFVVTSEQSSEGELLRDKASVTMTVRVPAARFDDALAAIRETASRVIVEKITGKDVTEEFVDLEARLKAKKAQEEQTFAILKRANTVEDALKVQNQLSAVRSEIEQIQGRMRYLENQSALSTITVGVRTPASVTGNSGGFFYELRTVFSDSIENALSFVLTLIKVVLAIIPFLLLVVLPLGLVVRYGFKKYVKRETGVQQPERSVFERESTED